MPQDLRLTAEEVLTKVFENSDDKHSVLYQQFVHKANGAYSTNHVKVHMTMAKFRAHANRLADRLPVSDTSAMINSYIRSMDRIHPYYAADLSLNLTKGYALDMNDIQSFIIELRDKGIDHPGVTHAFTYVGAPLSTFAMHIEDMDLYSSNLLFVGGEKVWHIVSPMDFMTVEAAVRNSFNKIHDCGQDLRHKMYVLTPAFLDDHGIRHCEVRMIFLHYSDFLSKTNSFFLLISDSSKSRGPGYRFPARLSWWLQRFAQCRRSKQLWIPQLAANRDDR